MRKNWIPFYIALFAIFGLNGCAMGRGANATIGSHGKESILSDNKLEGLYLFKIETNQNNITVTAQGDAKVGL